MSQYKVGTVSVTTTSATVTGTGTAWLANAAIGDYLVVQDSSLSPAQIVAYEIGGVVSDAELTLTAPYGGTTGSGFSYAAHRDYHPNGAPKFANGDVETAAIQNRWNSLTQSTAAFGPDAFVNSIDSVEDLFGLIGTVAGQQVSRAGWRPGNFALADPYIGGGAEIWVEVARSAHNGGTIKSPTVPVPTNYSDPVQIKAYLDGDGETSPATSGVWVLLYDELFVEYFGASGKGVIDDLYPIRSTMALAKSTKQTVNFLDKESVYAISDELFHKTSTPLASTASNGIALHCAGLGGCTIKALAGFPADTALINLDGNENNETTTASAVHQLNNSLLNIILDCNSIAERGLQLRAVAYSLFENINIIDAAGDGGDAALYINGVTGVAEDDTDTTSHCTFNNVKINGAGGFGVLGVNNRCSTMEFNSCDIRDCEYDGMRLAFAGLTLNTCTFAGNGSVADATTGGFSAVKSATESVNRGLVLNNCEVENNYNHDINIEWCYGYVVDTGLLTPFENAASGQVVMKIGAGVDGESEAIGGVINAPRISAYSISGPGIMGFEIGPNTRDLEINKVTFSEVGSNWYSQAQRYSIDGTASGIVIDGVDVSNYPEKTMFNSTLVTSGTPVGNVTGDGTEYTAISLSAASTMPATTNAGPQREVNTITAGSITATTLTVTAVAGTPLRIGNRLVATGILPNTFITAYISGAGGTGTYSISRTQTVSSGSIRSFSTQWFDRYGGDFEAPRAGFYTFEARWPLTGFGAAITDIEVAVVVDPLGAPVRHIVSKETPISPGATNSNVYGGTRNIFLSAGDVVTSSVTVSGSTKVVDIDRNIPAPGGFVFSVVEM